MIYKKRINVGFYGMSHLGLVYSAAAITKKINVKCFDEDKKLIEKLSNNIFPIYEPGIKKIFKKKKNIFSHNLNQLKECKIVFYSLDTPTNQSNKTDLAKVKKKINKLFKFLNPKAIFVLLSQVEPGFTRSIKWPKSRKFYKVETLIFGKALERAKRPERVIIGSDNNEKNREIKRYFNKFTKNIIFTNYETAELIKISINLMLISNLTMANAISEFKFKKKIIMDDLIYSLRLDERIGKKAYIKPGLGISGGNLERDLEAAIKLSFNSNNKLLFNNYFQNIKKISKYRKKWLFRKLMSYKNLKNICLLGLTYKENTSAIKNSIALELIRKLKKINFSCYDPQAKLIRNYKNLIRFNNPYEACKNSELMIISTPWKEFKRLNINRVTKLLKKKIILDPFSTIITNNKKVKIITL